MHEHRGMNKMREQEGINEKTGGGQTKHMIRDCVGIKTYIMLQQENKNKNARHPKSARPCSSCLV